MTHSVNDGRFILPWNFADLTAFAAQGMNFHAFSFQTGLERKGGDYIKAWVSREGEGWKLSYFVLRYDLSTIIWAVSSGRYMRNGGPLKFRSLNGVNPNPAYQSRAASSI